MRNCVKTGCDVAYAHSPGTKYRCDMFVFDNTAIFRFNSNTRFDPENPPDIMIDGNSYLEIPQTIIVELFHVVLCNAKIQSHFDTWCPALLLKVQQNVVQ